MDRDHILEEIRRTAAANGGKPLGAKRFEQVTGIRRFEWYGKHWARWGEAVAEAGHIPNELQGAYPDDHLLESYARLTSELRRLPSNADLRLRAGNDSTFPNEKVFYRLGGKAAQVAAVEAYCRERSIYPDVVELCVRYERPKDPPTRSTPRGASTQVGFVYLIKSGRYYKLGRTNATGRRERELAIQLPEKTSTVHVIKTDDPVGIEAYWHKRFEGKRKHGEWFELDADDIGAFKRRTYM